METGDAKKKKISTKGCIIFIICTIAFCYFLSWLGDIQQPKVYLVTYTEYFHSTNDPNKCRFIKIAKDRDYKIEKKAKENLYLVGYKMCHECFPENERKEYESKVKKYREERARYNSDMSEEDSEEDDETEYDEDYYDDGIDEVTDRYNNRTP